MMTNLVDPARAQLITQEYRYAIVEDAMIKARYPNAREIDLDTNLDQTGGTALAHDLFAQTSTFARTFTFTVPDLLYPEDFLDSSPRYLVDLPRQAADLNTIYTVISAKIDFGAGTTELTVRAS